MGEGKRRGDVATVDDGKRREELGATRRAGEKLLDGPLGRDSAAVFFYGKARQGTRLAK